MNGLLKNMNIHLDIHHIQPYLDNTYIRLGAAVGGLGLLLCLGMRHAITKLATGRVTGEPAPKFSPTYLKNKRVLVVGGTNGIGYAVSQQLVQNGAHVIIVGRTDPKDNQMKFIQADLSTVRSQTKFAEELPNPESLDMIIFTQGILPPPNRTDNGEGIELDLAISYIGRKVILEKLLERGAKPQRVLIWAAAGNEVSIVDWNGKKSYDVWPQHMNTVAANDALVLGLRKRRPDIPIYCLNPGIIKTDIRANLYSIKLVGKIVEFIVGLVTPTTRQYAKKIMNVVGAESISKSIVFFNGYGQPIHVSNYLSNPNNVEKIWEDSEQLIQQTRSN